jgi:PadR family transcriptional regulator PadR
MSESRALVLLGTLELLVLKLLDLGPMHGWGLAEQLEAMTDGVFCVNQGSLYPALQRLKRQGLVKARWQVTSNGRRARYYELTAKGSTNLANQREQWSRTSRAVNRVLASTRVDA